MAAARLRVDSIAVNKAKARPDSEAIPDLGINREEGGQRARRAQQREGIIE